MCEGLTVQWISGKQDYYSVLRKRRRKLWSCHLTKTGGCRARAKRTTELEAFTLAHVIGAEQERTKILLDGLGSGLGGRGLQLALSARRREDAFLVSVAVRVVDAIAEGRHAGAVEVVGVPEKAKCYSVHRYNF